MRRTVWRIGGEVFTGDAARRGGWAAVGGGSTGAWLRCQVTGGRAGRWLMLTHDTCCLVPAAGRWLRVA
jgi:hypothetical protein